MAIALRGNIHWYDFGPVTGAELSGNRPALIVSNSLLNRRLQTAIALPTSRTEPPESARRQHVWLNESESFASARQIGSILQEKLGENIGRASNQEMQDIIASIVGRLCREHRPEHLETTQGPILIQPGTVLEHLGLAVQEEDINGLLVLDYNARNHMAVVVDLEYRTRNAGSPVAVPISINGGSRPATALIHRIQSLDLSQRSLMPIATAGTEEAQKAVTRLIQMIQD